MLLNFLFKNHMTKTAAVKLVNQIKANRANALLKIAYELGAASQAKAFGADDQTSIVFAKKASANFEEREMNSAIRQQQVQRVLLACLGR